MIADLPPYIPSYSVEQIIIYNAATNEPLVMVGFVAWGEPADLSRLRESRARRSDHPLTVALVVLADLATRGVPPAMAAASLNELVARNVSDGSLLSFRQNVERDLVGGRSPASALDARTRAMIDDDRRRP